MNNDHDEVGHCQKKMKMKMMAFSLPYQLSICLFFIAFSLSLSLSFSALRSAFLSVCALRSPKLSCVRLGICECEWCERIHERAMDPVLFSFSLVVILSQDERTTSENVQRW